MPVEATTIPHSRYGRSNRTQDTQEQQNQGRGHQQDRGVSPETALRQLLHYEPPAQNEQDQQRGQNQEAEEDPTEEFDLQEHPVYKPRENRGFIPSTYNVTTLQAIKDRSKNHTCDSIEENEKTFLPAVLLRATKAVAEQKKGPLQYLSFRNNGNQRFKGEIKKFRRLFIFASLLDNDQKVFVIFEYSPADERLFWANNPGKNKVSVGDRFCIIEPVFEGEFQHGKTAIIKTPLPFIEIEAPAIPRRMNMDDSREGEWYFVLKNVVIALGNLHLVETKCGGTFCDRTRIAEDQNMCACYTYSRKTSGTTGTAVIQMDVVATLPEGRSQSFEKVSSLRTTQLFYQHRRIPSNNQTDYLSPKILNMMRTKAKRLAHFINERNGWTIIGWAKRGSKNTLGVDTTETTASDDLKYNVSYLYPTNQADIDALTPYEVIEQAILQAMIGKQNHVEEDIGNENDAI